MKDVIFEINQNVEKLETLLASNIKDTRIIDIHRDICKKDIETIKSIIEFEDACDNYEAALLLSSILKRIDNILLYTSKRNGVKNELQ